MLAEILKLFKKDAASKSAMGIWEDASNCGVSIFDENSCTLAIAIPSRAPHVLAALLLQMN